MRGNSCIYINKYIHKYLFMCMHDNLCTYINIYICIFPLIINGSTTTEKKATQKFYDKASAGVFICSRSFTIKPALAFLSIAEVLR